MQIHESAEDYLESVLILKNQLGNVRSIDIVNYFDYSKPSISVAMKNLRMNGYVTVDSTGYIELTEKFFNDTATTEIYTLSLHDALPIWQ